MPKRYDQQLRNEMWNLYQQGAPRMEIAARLGISVVTVRTWINNIKRAEGITLDRDVQEQRRLEAWQLHQQGWSREKIAEHLSVSFSSVCDWIRTAESRGPESLQRKNPPGAAPKLTKEQTHALFDTLVAGPRSHGYPGRIWTTDRIIELIQQLFGIDYDTSAVSRLAQKWRQDIEAMDDGHPWKTIAWPRGRGWKLSGTKGDDPTPSPELRVFTPAQIHSVKSFLEQQIYKPVHHLRRPLRDRAIVFMLLSTGLRREELVQLDFSQVIPHTTEELRTADHTQIVGLQGKEVERVVVLSADARLALADYLEHERPQDESSISSAVFLSAAGLGSRSADGRLSNQAVNLMLQQIGLHHDSKMSDPNLHISPLRPHDLRHTFAVGLVLDEGADRTELKRRLGPCSNAYLRHYLAATTE